MNFWCITTFFNPAGYKSLVDNYNVFAQNLHRQNVNLLTLEVAFGEDPFWLKGNDIVQIRGNSAMWLKERLINHGISLLPSNCDAFAWIDADLLWTDDHWHCKVRRILRKAHIVQLFKRVFHLPRGHDKFQGKIDRACQGIVQQFQTARNWLYNRKEKNLPFAAPGFAWAARRDAFSHAGGIYDKDIVGSGDCVLVDCLLDSWPLHGYELKFNDNMKKDIQAWRQNLKKKRLNIDYLSVDVFHLWHGDLRNRKYMQRHAVLHAHNYDPLVDIRLNNGIFEWASEKPKMHREVKDYFMARREDGLSA